MEIKIDLNDEQIRRLKKAEPHIDSYLDESSLPISIILSALVLEKVKNPPAEYVDRLCDIRDCEDKYLYHDPTIKKNLCEYHFRAFLK